MKKLIWLLLGVTWASHGAELSAKKGIEFLALNGQDIERYGENANKTLELSKGQYQLVLRYEASVKRGSKDTLFTSKPYVVDIKMGDENASLSIPKMRFESQAQSYFRKPKWVFSHQGTQTELTGTELEGLGFGGFRNIEEAIAKFNQDKGLIAKPISTVSATAMPASLIATGEKPVKLLKDGQGANKQTPAFNQLTYWYLKASNDEKKAFKRWMIEADG